VIGNGAPKIVGAVEKILISLLDMVIRVSPKIAQAFGVLMTNILKILVENIPKIADAGLKMLIGLLEAISKNIYKVVAVVVKLISEFLRALGQQAPKLADAAAKMIIDFVNGISKAIDANAAELGRAGGRLAGSIVTGMVKGLAGGVGEIASAAGNLGKSALGGIGHVLGIHSPSTEFIKIGKFVNEGFAIGILGSRDQVQSALDKMKELLKSSMDASTAEIAAQKAKLDELHARKRTKANSAGIDAQIKKANAALAEAQNLKNKATAANTLYTKSLKDEQAKLLKLSDQYAVVTEKLKNASTALDDAKKLKDDFAKSITDKYSVLPPIDTTTTLDSYSNAIREITAKNNQFKKTLGDLRVLGMDDATYQKFLDEGLDAQPFLDSLVASGASGVAEIDKITADLRASASSMGNKAATDMYQAGLNAAQGLVDGLTKQQGAIEIQMEKLADAMVKALNKKLGIKSPSKVFEQVGRYSNEGLASGLAKYAGLVIKAAEGVGNTALDAVRSTMSAVGAAISGDLDMTPVIAPVLDLDAFRKDAAAINDILAPKSVTPVVSTQQATTIANDNAAAQKVQLDNEALAMVSGDSYQFIQNNTSPKALSSADIYRQTRNQLSIVKGALPK
jgi:hypothetical protein